MPMKRRSGRPSVAPRRIRSIVKRARSRRSTGPHGEDMIAFASESAMRERRAISGRRILRAVQLGRIEGDPLEVRRRDRVGERPRPVLGIRQERRHALVEAEELGRPRVVRRRHEPVDLFGKPERRVRLAPRHQHRRAILESEPDDARSGELLLQAVPERVAVEVDGRGGEDGHPRRIRREPDPVRPRVLDAVHGIAVPDVVPDVAHDPVVARIEPGADRSVPGAGERGRVAVPGLPEDRAPVQKPIEPVGTEPGAESLEVVRAHLVDGNHDDERGLLRSRRERGEEPEERREPGAAVRVPEDH
jgi:hypothetical protein